MGIVYLIDSGYPKVGAYRPEADIHNNAAVAAISPFPVKFNTLKSVAHSISDSLASGVCFLIGIYQVDIFGEAAQSDEGYIEVDFLNGRTTGSPASENLARAIKLFCEKVPEQCKKQDADYSRFTKFLVRFGTDAVYGPHFKVTVEDVDGRSSTEQYVGIPGRRIRNGH